MSLPDRSESPIHPERTAARKDECQDRTADPGLYGRLQRYGIRAPTRGDENELLAGQSAQTVIGFMRRAGIAIRHPGGRSPFLRRWRSGFAGDRRARSADGLACRRPS